MQQLQQLNEKLTERTISVAIIFMYTIHKQIGSHTGDNRCGAAITNVNVYCGQNRTEEKKVRDEDRDDDKTGRMQRIYT